MKQLSNKLILLYTIMMLVAGWSGWGILHLLDLKTGMELYPLIPVIFFVFGVVSIYTLTHINRNNERRVTNIYLIFKLSKFILSAIVVVTIFSGGGENRNTLLLTFAAFYFIYIFCEVFIYTSIEKADKARKLNE